MIVMRDTRGQTFNSDYEIGTYARRRDGDGCIPVVHVEVITITQTIGVSSSISLLSLLKLLKETKVTWNCVCGCQWGSSRQVYIKEDSRCKYAPTITSAISQCRLVGQYWPNQSGKKKGISQLE
jgi:hypothetical protein